MAWSFGCERGYRTHQRNLLLRKVLVYVRSQKSKHTGIWRQIFLKDGQTNLKKKRVDWVERLGLVFTISDIAYINTIG